MERLKRDHEYDFVYILRCERLDNLSFEVIFGNENSEPTHKYKVTYNSKGTYGYDINVEDLPLEETDPQYGKKTIEEIELLENNEDHRKNRIFDVVEEMPQFPGGPSALFDYLASSIKYPVVAEENGVQGRVVCTFIVELDGSITDVKVVKSVDPSLDKEAIRVLRYMPRWVPGKQNGSPVRVKYTVPVTFSLG